MSQCPSVRHSLWMETLNLNKRRQGRPRSTTWTYWPVREAPQRADPLGEDSSRVSVLALPGPQHVRGTSTTLWEALVSVKGVPFKGRHVGGAGLGLRNGVPCKDQVPWNCRQAGPVLEILAAGEPEVDVWWQRSGGVWWGGGLRIWGVGEGSGASQRLKVSCRLGHPLEAWGAGMHSREWLAAGLGWGQHLCAGVKFQGCVGVWRMRGARNSGCRAHVLGTRRGAGEFRVLGPDIPGVWGGRSESMQQEQRRADPVGVRVGMTGCSSPEGSS